MNNHGIVERVRLSLGGTATPGAAELALAAVTQALTDALAEDGELRLAGFGSFRLCERAPRRLLLPGTGKPALLPRRRVIRFTPAPATTLPAKQVASPSAIPS